MIFSEKEKLLMIIKPNAKLLTVWNMLVKINIYPLKTLYIFNSCVLWFVRVKVTGL